MGLDIRNRDRIEYKLAASWAIGSSEGFLSGLKGTVQQSAMARDVPKADLMFEASFAYDVHRSEIKSNTIRSDELKRRSLWLQHVVDARYLFDLFWQQLVIRARCHAKSSFLQSPYVWVSVLRVQRPRGEIHDAVDIEQYTV